MDIKSVDFWVGGKNTLLLEDNYPLKIEVKCVIRDFEGQNKKFEGILHFKNPISRSAPSLVSVIMSNDIVEGKHSERAHKRSVDYFD